MEIWNTCQTHPHHPPYRVKVIFSTDAVSEAQELEEDVEGEEESEEESGADFPVNVTILIEKKVVAAR